MGELACHKRDEMRVTVVTHGVNFGFALCVKIIFSATHACVCVCTRVILLHCSRPGTSEKNNFKTSTTVHR